MLPLQVKNLSNEPISRLLFDSLFCHSSVNYSLGQENLIIVIDRNGQGSLYDVMTYMLL